MAVEIIITVFRIILGFVFLFAGVVKLFDLRKFKLTVLQYGLLPVKIATIGAYFHPFFEILAGAMLFFNFYEVYGAILVIGMMIVANIFIIFAIKKQKKMEDCGCFGGVIKRPLGWHAVFENIVWTILAIIVLVYSL
ncbi:MAG: MauE/DoxX family redox-associated membrane protein [Candidatus Woesearchaeota archaeon]